MLKDIIHSFMKSKRGFLNELSTEKKKIKCKLIPNHVITSKSQIRKQIILCFSIVFYGLSKLINKKRNYFFQIYEI